MQLSGGATDHKINIGIEEDAFLILPIVVVSSNIEAAESLSSALPVADRAGGTGRYSRCEGFAVIS